MPLSAPPVNAGFLVSFMVDARGGAMRGCRHSGVRVIIPPRKAPMPMRVTCRYLKKDKLIHPPPLMEGEAIASRVLELGPAGAKFLGPVIIEVPHFASLRGKEREIVILRSDNGESWREHTLEATEEAVQEVLQDSFDEGETTQLEDLNTNRITRILTTDFPQYFAIISRIRQEVHAIGPEGGVVNSTVVPQVQAVFPQGALTKKIKVGLQAQPIPPELTAKLLGNRVAVSPIVTVEPRRRKFHKPITLTIPVPVAASKGMINQYSGDTPTLRLLCSITGGTTRAQWEDVTGSTPLTFVNDCVNFTTTVSARFWLMDCRNVGEATKMATSLYKEAIYVPFMAKFCVFSKRHEMLEARMRVFCMTDDKEEKTLEHQEHFHEVAKSRDVEVMEGKTHHLEFYGNLFPVTKSGEQLSHKFHAFRENRLPFTVRVKDPNSDPIGRISFFIEPKRERGEAQQQAICNLNINLPDDISPEPGNVTDQDILAIQAKYSFLREAGYGKFDTIHRADLRVSDISNLLGSDWVKLARELEIDDQDINLIISEYPDNVGQQAMVMLRLWLNTEGNKATGNALEKALKQCDRQDIVNKCMFNIEMVTDNDEQEVAQSVLAREEGYDAFKKELSPVNNSTMKPLTRDYSIDVNVDESEYAHEQYVAAERLAGITEEISSRSDTFNETSLKQEEATSVYEREEQKYVAEEKEFASSYHKEVQQEQVSTNQITQSQILESTHRENNVITEKMENRNDYLHEEMNRMSIDEKQSMTIKEGDKIMEKTTESKMEEEHKEKEMYNNEMSETKQSKTEERDDGTVLILTDTKKQSREAFMTESHDTRHYEQAQIMTGMDSSEAVRVTESKFESETFDQGLEEQYSANVEERIKTFQKEGTTSPSQPRPASSSFDDEESEPESPRSPSPKVSPGSKSPSPRVSQHNSHHDLPRQSSSPYGESSGASSNESSRNDLDNMIKNDVAPLMKETDQELLDEMIVKDVPESESSTDPVKKFEETHPSAGIDSIQEDASDSECDTVNVPSAASTTLTSHLKDQESSK